MLKSFAAGHGAPCGDCGPVDSLSSKNKAAAACEHEAATPGTLPTLYELVDAERKKWRNFPALRTRWRAQAALTY